MRTRTTLAWYGAAVLTTAAAVGVAAQDWTTHGGDLGESRFSPLTQITKANVGNLERAWEFEAGASNLQLTPLVVGGQMYIAAGQNIFAVEPETGKQLWRFEAPGTVSRRGVAYWPGDAKTPARLYSGAGDRLIALDAKSGRLVPEFGTHGLVELSAGIKGDVDGRTSLVSPPIVYKDLLITGGNNGEQAPSLGTTATSAPGTPAPAPSSGRSTPCRGPVSPASTPGKVRAGRAAPAPTCGRSSRSTPSGASSTRRWARRRPTTTAATARA